MRASILIAAHDEGALLWKTIRACVETCAGLDYEIVVADDASTDGSVRDAERRYPQIRVVRNKRRLGASPTKHLAAVQARGDVLVFLDGHCNPELGAIRRLVEDVEHLEGRAIVTPSVPALCTKTWTNKSAQVGHGYRLGLEKLDCGWVPLGKMRVAGTGSFCAVRGAKGACPPLGRRKLYESPALIGCALAVSRALYDELHGFDPHMFYWGVEDLDFGLRSWLMGHPILHDPKAAIGHRFRNSFDNYSVPFDHLVVNQLRMARKNFTQSVWADWLERCRRRSPQALPDHPEGFWARVWELFLKHEASAESERAYVHARRERDEFWYAERFGLSWPKLGAAIAAPRALAFADQPSTGPSAVPSASPSPPPSGMDVWVNDTKTHDDDFVVASPAGADRPYTDLTMKWYGEQSVSVKLTSTGKGKVSFSGNGPFTLKKGDTKTVKMFGETPSEKKDDCVVKISDAGSGKVLAEAPVTVIDEIDLHFEGSFQCRLATDKDASNDPTGHVGWTYKLPLEPNLDRIIRFSSPVALRKYVVFTPVKITKLISQQPLVEFTQGDSVIGEAINLGPQTLFNGNNTQGNPPVNPPGREPLQDFQVKIGSGLFSGQSTTAPKGQGAVPDPEIEAELKKGELGTVDKYFRERYDKLKNDWDQMTPAQQASPAGQDLKFRLTKFKGNYLQPNAGWQAFYALVGSYPGDIDKTITINAGSSKALKRFAMATKFRVSFDFSKFDGEALVGSVEGFLRIKP